MSDETSSITGTAGDVPYVLRPPATRTPTTPLVVIWHLGDPPRSGEAMAAAIPLHGVNAWRLYPTLPLAGKRMPPGGVDEVMKLGMEDAVLKLFEPIQSQAVRELPALLAAVHRDHDVPTDRIAVVGGSMGGAIAQTVLAESDLPVVAASLLVPAVQLRVLVEGIGAAFGVSYTWTPAATAAAARFDFVARAGELARRKIPIQCVLGEDDAAFINEPAQALHGALLAAGLASDDLVWERVPGLRHALAEEPGLEPAPQTDAARTVDAAVTRFLRARLA